MATRRAQVIIDNIARPDYQPLLRDYLDRARQRGGHVPHLFAEAFGWYDSIRVHREHDSVDVVVSMHPERCAAR